MGFNKLRCPHNLNGFTADPQPDWSFADLIELDTVEKKLITRSDFYKKQPRKLRASKESYCGTGGFVMRVTDRELGISDSDAEEEVHNSSIFSGRRFASGELNKSDSFDFELFVNTQCLLMNKMGLAEGALHEQCREFQLHVSEEVRKENENFASRIAEIGKRKKAQQEREREFDLQYRRTIDEILDNHLAAVRRDFEHISLLEEKRIRDDAALEKTKREEKALMEEKICQERIKTEEEAKLQAKRAKMAKAVAEAEKQAVEEKKQAAEIGKHKKAQQEREREFDLQYRHTFAEALDNHLSAVRRDFEHISLLDEKRIRDDAAREKTKREGKTLMEEKIRQKRIKAEDQVKRQAKRAEMAKAVAEAEKQAVEQKKQAAEAATTKSAVGTLRDVVHKGNRRTGKDFNRLIKTISATVENVRTKADELVNLINSPEYPQSVSILSFAEKVVSNCENSQKSNGFIFACSRVIVLVTSKIPLALDILTVTLNRACMYTMPKFVEYSPVLFQTREAYSKAIGYKEIDGKVESTDSYIERLSSNMRLFGALVQTEIGGFQSPLGLKQGWAWIARFLNSLPANLYTAVALQYFLEMSGYALYRRYRNQFEKLLRIIARDFLKALKEGKSGSVNAKLIKVKTSIINYIESSQFKKEPEGLQLREHLDSNDFFVEPLS